MPLESPQLVEHTIETAKPESPNRRDEMLKVGALKKADDAIEGFRTLHEEIRLGLPDHFFEKDIIPRPDISAFMEYLRVKEMEDELAPLLKQLTRTVTIHNGDTVLHIGSGWGKASREIEKIFSEGGLNINVVEFDISSDVVDFSARTNQVQGFNERIRGMHGDVLDPEGLRQPFSEKPRMVFSIGLVRYLKEDDKKDIHEIQNMLDNLLFAASEGTYFVFIDTNKPSMDKLEEKVRARGIQSYYDDEEREKTLRYTRFYSYYCIYNNVTDLTDMLAKEKVSKKEGETGPEEFLLTEEERKAFRQAVDEEVLKHPDYYPEMDQELREILGDDEDLPDLRYMGVIADLAGYIEMDKQILIFRK